MYCYFTGASIKIIALNFKKENSNKLFTNTVSVCLCVYLYF